MAQMDQRMPLDSAALQAALLPWMAPPSGGQREERTAAVREEAQLILQILQHVEVMASHDEVCRTFSRTPRELHLAQALLVGGAAGELDRPRMLGALRAAAAAGSAWAPLWLGDMEGPRLDTASEGAVERNVHDRRRGWYIQAAERGHPDAPRRLAAAAGTSASRAQPAAPAAGLASAFASGGGLQANSHSETVLATDGTEEEDELEAAEGQELEGEVEAEEAMDAASGLGLGDTELCSRLAEVARAVCATSDEMGEAGSLCMISLKPMRSRL